MLHKTQKKKNNMNKNLNSFLGSMLVLILAILIFFTLMTNDMPDKNRELLIAFVSVLFGGMAASIKNILGTNSKEEEK
jgi:uncharacterized membrane protein